MSHLSLSIENSISSESSLKRDSKHYSEHLAYAPVSSLTFEDGTEASLKILSTWSCIFEKLDLALVAKHFMRLNYYLPSYEISFWL